MKVQHYVSTAGFRGNVPSPTTGLLDIVRKTVGAYEYLLPNGWRALFELYYGASNVNQHELSQEKHLAYTLDVSSDLYKGVSDAAAKMRAMQVAQLQHSGNLPMPAIVSHLRDLLSDKPTSEQEQALHDLECYDDISLVSAPLINWMRDELEFSPYLGALSVPYVSYRPEASKVWQNKGIINVSFYGTRNEDRDVMFATRLLHGALRTIKATDTSSSIHYDLHDLYDIPIIRFWLEQLNFADL